MKQNHLFLLLALAGCGVAPRAGAVLVAEAAESGPEASAGDEDTPVVAEPIERPPSEGADRGWVKPDYSNQEQALGWSPDVFKTPKGMEERVAFWKDIFTKYTTEQGILHDSRYLNLIYEALDFSHLALDPSMSPGDRERFRRKKVKEAKKAIEERLKRLQKLTTGDGLEGEDLRYWKLFENIQEPNKFSEAAKRGRLRFQLGQRDRFIEGIYQSGRHLKEMEEIFRREGVPVELTRLPFVESSFNMKARSKVGASGIWQFMRSTARAYMRMDASVDERNDPLRATVAAARKMRNNFQMLETWPLAVTGYNHGPSGVQRLVRKYKTTDIAELTDVRKGRFGFASANFYASFLAALQIEEEAESHFGPVKWMAELRGFEVKLTRFLRAEEILKWFGGDLAKAQTYNPHVRPQVWRRGALQPRTFVRVPVELAATVENELRTAKFVPPVAAPENEAEYIIQEGETLGEIAARFKVKIQELMEMNGIDNPRRVRAQQKIIIPSRVGANSPPAAVGP